MPLYGRGLLLAAGLSLLPLRGEATVAMQNQARRLGLPVKNCLYCHASPHAAEAMKAKARAAGIAEGNCLACHGADIPAALNHRGEWLAAQKLARKAKEWDMAWLKDYKEPAAPKPTPTPKPAPSANETIKVQQRPQP